MTKKEWFEKGEKLFGKNIMKWKFKCPSCGYIASVQDYKDAGAPEGAAGFSCIGRWIGAKKDAFVDKGNGPCNYAGGGLFCINPIEINGDHYFEFVR